mmetsp:Transcript_5386/g.13474  ORF Transcript_5386/g.13474 Transcript_5386/m.13474 type:complete len:226 (+) Transcript_5386:50-727(+)
MHCVCRSSRSVTASHQSARGLHQREREGFLQQHFVRVLERVGRDGVPLKPLHLLKGASFEAGSQRIDPLGGPGGKAWGGQRAAMATMTPASLRAALGKWPQHVGQEDAHTRVKERRAHTVVPSLKAYQVLVPRVRLVQGLRVVEVDEVVVLAVPEERGNEGGLRRRERVRVVNVEIRPLLDGPAEESNERLDGDFRDAKTLVPRGQLLHERHEIAEGRVEDDPGD